MYPRQIRVLKLPTAGRTRAAVNLATARLFAALFFLAATGGAAAAQPKQSGFLHPKKKPLTEAMVAEARAAASRVETVVSNFQVSTPDGAVLKGWKVPASKPNGDWVVLLHGVSDNRIGVLSHGEMLLRHGYSVVLMDARAHGESGGAMATYGWLERNDMRAVADALLATEKVHCLFALGESMGASILLQAGEVEPRLAGVVAEAAFANLREAGYTYASLGMGSWLGKSLLRPMVSGWVNAAEKEGGFKVEDVSPERAVAARAFPVLLIAGSKDRNIPAGHSRRIFKAAIGAKELWVVPGARHTGAFGHAPQEFEHRVIAFYGAIHGRALASEPNRSNTFTGN